VDGYAAELLVDGGEEGDDLVMGLLAEEVEGPCAVFSAGPAEEDGAGGGVGWGVDCGVQVRLLPV
jgi:hypothetical protein